MKKKILSAILAIAMLVAVIPAMTFPTAAVANSTVGYKTTVTTDILAVDGQLDAAYLRSDQIKTVYKSSASNQANDFIAYTAANAQGLYVWASVEDTTQFHAKDRLTIYFNFRAMHNSEDNLQNSYMHINVTPGASTVFSVSGILGLNDITTYLTVEEGVGYTVEYFIPWQDVADKVGAKSDTALPVSIAFEAHDHDLSGTRLSYSGDSAASNVNVYYNAFYTYSVLNYVAEEDMPAVKIVGANDRMAAYTSSAIAVDGTMDSVYTGGTKITFDAIGSEKDANDYAYVAFTDNDIYVFINMADTSDDAAKDNVKVYHRFFTRTNNTGIYYASGAYQFNRNNTASQPGHHYNGHIPANIDIKGMSAIEYKIVDNPGVGYTVEIKYPLSAAEKNLINTSTGMTVDFGFETHNGSTYNACCVAGNHFQAWKSAQIIPSVHLVKDTVSYAIVPQITGASVSLGEDISLNYYTMLSPLDADAQMRFTFNGNVYFANAKKTEINNQYKFTFDGIPPQCMADNVKAEIIIDGQVVANVDNYSVLENCQHILEDDKTSDEAKQLIYDLLAYGTAAQKYAQYKTDKPINAGYEKLATVVTSVDNNDKKLSPDTISGARISAAGVYYDNINKVYAKIEIDGADVSKLKATVNGVETKIKHYRDNVYIVYSEAIKVAEFDNVYTFVVHDGTDSQTLVYSINAYAKAKINSTNSATAGLAKATYAYGQSAKAYVNSLARAEVNITNLYDKSLAFAGYVSGNKENAHSAHYTSDYISVTPGEKLYFGPCRIGQDFQLQGYDSSKTLSHSLVGYGDKSIFTVEAIFDNGYVIYSYIVPAGVAYLRFVNPSAYNNVYMISREPITLDGFKAYWGEGNTLDLYSPDSKINNLYDKSVAFYGYISNTGKETSGSHYTSHYVSVFPGEKIYFGPCNPSQGFHVHAYDAERNNKHAYVSKGSFTVEATFDNGYVIYSYVIPSDTYYLRIATPLAYNDVYTISREPITLDSFKEYWGEGNTLDLYSDGKINNLYDKSLAFAGYVDGNNVAQSSAANYTSDYISVTPGEKIYFGPCRVAQDFQLHGYDSSKNISQKYVGLSDKSVFTVEATFDNGYVIYSYVIPSNTVYVRIANPSAYNNVYMISREPITLDSFKEYWGEGNTLDLYSLYEKYTSAAFTGKSALFLGDSICAANCESGKTYQGWSGRIAMATGMTCTNKGVSGASISTCRAYQNNVIYDNHYSSVRNNSYDFIILHGGVNDAWDNASVGVMTNSYDPADFDTSTYAGGLEKLFYYVTTEHPDAKIGYIFNFAAPACTKGTVSNMSAYFNMAKQICDKWNVPYLNMYEDDALSAELKVTTTTYLPDNIHPNTAGYDILYKYIMYWMETLPVNSTVTDAYDLEALPTEISK